MYLTIVEDSLVRQTMALFLVRDFDFTPAQAQRELNYLMLAPGLTGTQTNYLMQRRLGSTVSLNRAERMRVYMAFQNAINHATADRPAPTFVRGMPVVYESFDAIIEEVCTGDLQGMAVVRTDGGTACTSLQNLRANEIPCN